MLPCAVCAPLRPKAPREGSLTSMGRTVVRPCAQQVPRGVSSPLCSVLHGYGTSQKARARNINASAADVCLRMAGASAQVDAAERLEAVEPWDEPLEASASARASASRLAIKDCWVGSHVGRRTVACSCVGCTVVCASPRSCEVLDEQAAHGALAGWGKWVECSRLWEPKPEPSVDDAA